MYLVDCWRCRTEFSNLSRICPRCGTYSQRVSAVPPQGFASSAPVVETGESRWDREA